MASKQFHSKTITRLDRAEWSILVGNGRAELLFRGESMTTGWNVDPWIEAGSPWNWAIKALERADARRAHAVTPQDVIQLYAVAIFHGSQLETLFVAPTTNQVLIQTLTGDNRTQVALSAETARHMAACLAKLADTVDPDGAQERVGISPERRRRLELTAQVALETRHAADRAERRRAAALGWMREIETGADVPEGMEKVDAQIRARITKAGNCLVCWAGSTIPHEPAGLRCKDLRHTHCTCDY